MHTGLLVTPQGSAAPVGSDRAGQVMSRPSGPAMAWSMMAASVTYRASGPNDIIMGETCGRS